jgi:hypothetical protein
MHSRPSTSPTPHNNGYRDIRYIRLAAIINKSGVKGLNGTFCANELRPEETGPALVITI